jgi:hypothetical protein
VSVSIEITLFVAAILTVVAFNGVTLCFPDWAQICNYPASTFQIAGIRNIPY